MASGSAAIIAEGRENCRLPEKWNEILGIGELFWTNGVKTTRHLDYFSEVFFFKKEVNKHLCA